MPLPRPTHPALWRPAVETTSTQQPGPMHWAIKARLSPRQYASGSPG
jgi:hypothetical protein